MGEVNQGGSASANKFDRLYDHERRYQAMRDAAPELYEALEVMCVQFGGLPAGNEKQQAAFDNAVAALARARGDSNE